MSGTIPLILPYFGASSGNSGSPNVNRVNTMPVTNDPINTTNTTNVSQSVFDDNLPQLLDSRGGSHVTNVLAFDKEDFTRWKVRFLVFFDEIEPYLLKTLEDGPFVPMSSLSASENPLPKHQNQCNEFMADLNAEYHERALLENLKRFYKRSDRVRSAKKPLDKTKETFFAYGKLGHFQKDYPSHKTSTPFYPSSNNSLNKSKPYTPSFNQISSQNFGNHQKDYKGNYKGLKAKMVVLTKRIDDMTKITKIRAFMAIAKDEPSLGKADARSGQRVDITMKKVHRLLSMTDGNERKHVLDYTHVDLYCVEHQRKNLESLPKLIEAAPSGISESLISLSDLTLNMIDLTLETPETKNTRPYVKMSHAYVIKKKIEKFPADPNQGFDKKS
uniref:Uncharacterized protein n=1 Tax=Tanacetum cinerariifolium TaxID=118510 RepID=A0A699H2H6_TANCI|nr:hypothetical protein [Tanacetum cinerariifolium]